MQRRSFFSVIIFLFITLFSLNAQDSDWFWDKPISKVEFEGLKNIKKSDLTAILNTYIGDPFTESVYTEMLDRLYSMDMFLDIEPYAEHDPKNADTVLVKFVVTERPIITAINFVGNQKIRNGELRDVIKIKTSDIFVENKVLIDERLLRDHYIEKGYADVKVSHKLEEKNNGFIVTFVINEGANTVINSIKFSGNTIVSERALKSRLQLKEVGFFNDGAFQSSLLEYDKHVILNYYRERGYVDVEIPDVKIETNFNAEKARQEMTITFIIKEGSQYLYNGVTVTGNSIFDTDKILSCVKLQSGAIFDSVRFEEGIAAIQSLYVENGYMATVVYPVPNKDSEKKLISYNIMIRESTRSHIENIIVKGNTKTKDYVIKREIPLEEGDVFSRDKVINGVRNLYNLQYFSNVIPDLQQGSEADLVDLVFSVEEQSTTTLNFGMTFSGITDPNDIPISLYASVQNSNLFGEGKSISASLNIAKNEQSIDLTYGQNWLFDLPIAFSQSLSFAHKQSYAQLNMFNPDLTLDQYYYYMNYTGWTASLGSAISRRWTPDFAIISATAGISNSLTNYEYDETLYTPTDLGISTFANRWGVLNTLWASVSVDGRNINYDPSEGWFASERLGWYGLIPGLEKEFFLKSDTKFEAYHTLFDIPVSDKWNFKGILAGYTGLSLLVPTPDTTITDSNRLYIDGMFNGRGWTELYRNSTAKGQAMWSSNIEFRVPVVPGMLGVDLFHDAVVVKPDFSEMLTDLSINDFYFSFGPGIRFLIPQFPIHLLFAFRYNFVDGKPQWADNPFQFVLSFNITNK